MLGHGMLMAAGANGKADYKALILADAPSALWMLNEPSGSACAEAVAGLNATLQGTYSRAQPGPAGIGGLSTTLSGDAYATTPETTTLDAPTLSVEFWFKQTNSAGNALSYGSYNYLRFQTSGSLNTIFSNANKLSSSVYSLNTWHHGVCIVSASGLKTYIDGALAGSNASAYPNQAQSNVINIGVGNGREYFVGSIAAVAIYKKELTASQVLAHYSAGK